MSIYYPFFWAVLAAIGSLAAVLLDILSNEYELKADIRRTKLRDKAHYAVMQNRGAT